MYYILAGLLLLSGCGIKVKSDPLKVEPVTITHKIVLNTDQLYDHYLKTCEEEAVDPNDDAAIKACADDRLNSFIEEFTTII